MSIEFDWQDAEDERWHEEDDAEWRAPQGRPQEPPPHTPRPGRKPKGRTMASLRTSDWGIVRTVRYLGLGVLIGTLISAGIVYYVAQRNRSAARADLQAVITAEARALSTGDEEIYLSLQDDSNQSWQNLQRLQLEDQRSTQSQTNLTLDDFVLNSDVAWATVGYTEEGAHFQRLQFYRLQDGNWRRTAPDVTYWGDEKSLETRHLRFVYRARDEQLVQALSGVAEDFYARTHLDFNVGASPQLTFYLEPDPKPASPLIGRGEFRLPSPQMTGVRVDGQLPTYLVQTIAYDLGLRLAMEKSNQFLDARRLANGNWVMLHGVVYWQLQRLVPNNTVIPGLKARFAAATSSNQTMPLASLWPPYRFGNLDRTSLALAEAYDVVTYLADSTDPGRIPLLLRALGDGSTPAETLQAAGVNPREFETAWRSYALAP